MEIIIREIEYGSSEYQDEVKLRDEILRKPLGLVFTPEQLAEEVNEFHLCAFANEEIVGCLLLKPIDKVVIKMRQVAVKSDLQNSGIGKQLVLFSESFAREKGYSIITMHARNSAVPFYEKLGYKKEGNEFIEVTIPHYTMIKNL